MKRRRAGKRGRFAKASVAVFLTVATALAVWELAFLRLWQLRDRTAVRVLQVPANTEDRELVVGPQNPYWTPLGAISPLLIRCVVTSEDARFWQHRGFDWEELQNSFDRNVAQGGFERGGSTITMQLAKNLFLWRGKSLVRKVLEAYLTWRLEHTLEKKRILELYLNVVEWGPGIYGIGEASRYYYEKPPSQLGLGEGAMLAAILPNPVHWNPKRAPAVALRRQQELMSRVLRENVLPENDG